MNTEKTWPFPFVSTGLQYGLVAGLVAAELFSLVFLAVSCITQLIEGHFDVALVFVVGLYSQVFGVLPALLVGGCSGMLIGLVFHLYQRALSVQQGIMLGTLLAGLLGIVLLMLVAVWHTKHPQALNVFAHDRSLFFILDLPILMLYLGAGAWGGGKLARARLEQLEFRRQLAQKTTLKEQSLTR